MPALVVIEGPAMGQRLELDVEVTLSRIDTPALQQDGEVSRRHAVVRVVADGLEVEDLGSSNGTFVARVAHGATLRVGRTVFSVEDERGDTKESPTPSATVTSAVPPSDPPTAPQPAVAGPQPPVRPAAPAPVGPARPAPVNNALIALWAAAGTSALFAIVSIVFVAGGAGGGVSCDVFGNCFEVGGSSIAIIFGVLGLLAAGAAAAVQVMTVLRMQRSDWSYLRWAFIASIVVCGVIFLNIIISVAAIGVDPLGLLVGILALGGNGAAIFLVLQARKHLGV
jgi:hypothetical protein